MIEPTYLNFKYEAETDDGEPVGPAWTSIGCHPGGPDTVIGYMTMAEAERYAAEHGYVFNEA